MRRVHTVASVRDGGGRLAQTRLNDVKHLANDRRAHIVNLLLHELYDEVFAQLIDESIVVQRPQYLGVVLQSRVSHSVLCNMC
jgi:transcriptional regulator CtsR